MLNFYEEHCRLLSTYMVQQISILCLQIDYLGYDENKKTIISGADCIVLVYLKCRNEIIFDIALLIAYMQVLFRATHWCLSGRYFNHGRR
jgi:hypothetical protein